MRKALLGVALALWLAPAGQAATRLLYTSTWSGHAEVYALGPLHNRPLTRLTGFGGSCEEPPPYVPISLYPAPSGRYVAVSCGSGLWLMRTNGRERQELVPPGGLGGGPPTRVRWSPDSKLLGYEADGEVRVVEPATNLRRIATPRDLSLLQWSVVGFLSPNGRWVAYVGKDRSDVTNLRSRRRIPLPGAFDASWSPKGRRLALESTDGIRVVDLHTGRVRLLVHDVGFGKLGKYDDPIPLGLAWSPDGGRIAYVTGRDVYAAGSWSIRTGDLRVVTLAGRVTTLVPSNDRFGSQIKGLAWVTAQTPAARLRDEFGSFLAGGAIELLAADGKRVAFEACDTVAIWIPGTVTSDPPLSPNECSRNDLTGGYGLYDLALAGDRLVYGLTFGCNSINVSLTLRVLAPTGGGGQIAHSFGSCGAPFRAALGRAAGSGDLLVYGEWAEAMTPGFLPPFPVTNAMVRRVDGSCPCPVIASTPGPLYPADVNEGRVVAYGDNSTIVIDRNGNRLLTLPVSPQAAQLSNNDLVLLVNGELRDYDVRDGALLHTWTMPNVPSGPVCGWRHCETVRLVLNDVARGRVVYILDSTLHLLRLADGADVAIGPASLARFMDDGLVYSDGARIHFVGYPQLPLNAP